MGITAAYGALRKSCVFIRKKDDSRPFDPTLIDVLNWIEASGWELHSWHPAGKDGRDHEYLCEREWRPAASLSAHLSSICETWLANAACDFPDVWQLSFQPALQCIE